MTVYIHTFFVLDVFDVSHVVFSFCCIVICSIVSFGSAKSRQNSIVEREVRPVSLLVNGFDLLQEQTLTRPMESSNLNICIFI